MKLLNRFNQSPQAQATKNSFAVLQDHNGQRSRKQAFHQLQTDLLKTKKAQDVSFKKKMIIQTH
jgi:hypothetical protein